MLPEEHLGHLEPFLRAHPDFALVAQKPILWTESIEWKGGTPLVDPGTSRTDGYGVLCFERTKNK